MSAIEWTDETWNPVVGCSPVSPGCVNCYAAREAIRLAKNPHPAVSDAYEGTAEMRGVGAKRRPVFTGTVRLMFDRLEQPLHWSKPRRVFVNSMSDLFHEAVPFRFIARVVGVMALCPDHTFQILTKRPERAAAMAADLVDLLADHFPYLQGRADGRPELAWGRGGSGEMQWPLPNVWIGTSVENQETADERIPHLLRTPAAVRFLSCEPLLGPVDLHAVRYMRGSALIVGDEGGPEYVGATRNMLRWVIVGGESGPRARPCDVDWIRSIVRQCREARVPVFVKQLGARPLDWDAYQSPEQPVCGCRGLSECEHVRMGPIPMLRLSDRKGGDPSEWPEDLRIREFPQ